MIATLTTRIDGSFGKKMEGRPKGGLIAKNCSACGISVKSGERPANAAADAASTGNQLKTARKHVLDPDARVPFLVTTAMLIRRSAMPPRAASAERRPRIPATIRPAIA